MYWNNVLLTIQLVFKDRTITSHHIRNGSCMFFNVKTFQIFQMFTFLFTSVYIFSSVSTQFLQNAEFRSYENKRMTSVTSTIMTSSFVQCTTMCLRTNGCLAVAITNGGNDAMLCSLATHPSNQNGLVDDATADVCVLGEPSFNLITVRQRRCGKVIFSFVSVNQSIYPQGGPM